MWKSFKLWLVEDELAVFKAKSEADTALLNNARAFKDKAEAEFKEKEKRWDELMQSFWHKLGEEAANAVEIGRKAEEYKRQVELLKTELVLKAQKGAKALQGLQMEAGLMSRGFAGVTEETAWWQAVHAILNAQTAQERDAAVTPNLASESRHYNAGRCAALVDLQQMLITAREKEQRVEDGVKG